MGVARAWPIVDTSFVIVIIGCFGKARSALALVPSWTVCTSVFRAAWTVVSAAFVNVDAFVAVLVVFVTWRSDTLVRAGGVYALAILANIGDGFALVNLFTIVSDETSAAWIFRLGRALLTRLTPRSSDCCAA